MKRIFLVLLVLVGVGVPLALGTAAVLIFQDEPVVQRVVEFTPDDIGRARLILELNDPRQPRNKGMPTAGLHTLVLSAPDLDLAVNYLLHRLGRGSSRLAIENDAIRLDASIRMPDNPFGRFVNIHALVRETAGAPGFDELTLGRLRVPGKLAGLAFASAQQSFKGSDEYRLAADTIRSVRVADEKVQITYEWTETLPDRVRAVTLAAPERERLRIYHEHLAQLTASPGMPRSVSLAELAAPLMKLAVERSAAGQASDARAEQRALIAVLTFYVNGRNWKQLIPEAANWLQVTPREVSLRGRTDLAQHFTVSAAIAAFAGSPLADAIGLYKEIDDSRGGSGFSFIDLTADRAGTVFGQAASAGKVLDLQRRGSALVGEDALIPDIAGLPEFMAEAEFKRRFGGVGSPRYNEMMSEIERRVAACALYRR